tara:strand:+ start:1837 stop:2421 length:585 start_codon:yes stop_codon:yes gene_type:complete
MPISEQQIEEFASRTDRPIPGQSLTEDPNKPAPYEQPPQVTTRDEGVQYFMDIILEEDTYSVIMDALEDGVPVMDLVQGILVNAFEEGVLNPDLMLMLAEPLAYLLLGLSEREGIRARIVSDPDDPADPDDLDNWDYDEDDEALMENSGNPFRKQLQSIQNPKNDEELNLDEVIKNAPSLMGKPSKTKPSLMAK